MTASPSAAAAAVDHFNSFLTIVFFFRSSAQIQGAITNKRRDFIWTLGFGNNGDSYRLLTRKLLQVLPEPKKSVMVIDNASWNRNEANMNLLRSKGINTEGI